MVSKLLCSSGSGVRLLGLVFTLLGAAPAALALEDSKPGGGVATGVAAVTEREELLTLRNTMLGMIERLVEEGVVTVEEAQSMIERAEVEAAAEAAETLALRQPAPDTVRVQYIPDIVKDELRRDILAGLRGEVRDEVIAEAKEEAWGVPGALPAWLYDIDWRADLRLRGETNLFDDDNQEGFYRDFQAINEAGGVAPAGENALLNVRENREQLEFRMRLGLNLRLSPNWQAGLRLTTSNGDIPVSRNVNLGVSDNTDLEARVDLAYLHYRSEYLTFSGGRILNPYIHSDLVWDPDLVFEGMATTLMAPIPLGNRRSRVFLTAGAFPLQEFELSSRDKWLYGGQVGTALALGGGSSLTLAAAYYLFDNVVGVRNEPESTLTDFTAPQFVQKGNTLFDIRNDTDENTELFALASEFELLNGTLLFDSGPLFQTRSGRSVHLSLSGDYVRNIGFDEQEILERTGLFGLDERTDGYRAAISLGTQRIADRGDWSVEAMIKHLERDAVPDGFTESNFHRGGTDAEGWGVNVEFGVAENTWLQLRYLTASEIDGPPLGIDTLQIDLNARF